VTPGPRERGLVRKSGVHGPVARHPKKLTVQAHKFANRGGEDRRGRRRREALQ
jgi:hypothetical protein